jgi:hypothetical protein
MTMNTTRFFGLISLIAVHVASAQHVLLLRDEGMSKLSLFNPGNARANWQVDVPAGRDLQLVGNGLVLLGTGKGYEERQIATGKVVREVTDWPGAIAARRLANGNTMLIGLNWQQQSGIVLMELSPENKKVRTIAIAGYSYARLFRQTPKGTFIITADKVVMEADTNGNIIWHGEVSGHESPHAWQAVRLANDETVVSTGYPSNLQFFSSAGALLRTVGGPADVNPHFFAGFQVLSNGNIVVTNWQGHGPGFGGQGKQLLEYDPKGALVWSWKQDASRFSSLQGVIVLDGLDLQRLHVEGENGALTPVDH